MEKLLGVLEQKINALLESKRKDLELIASLQEELVCLQEKNEQLLVQSEALEQKILSQDKSCEEINQERELTKMAVDELIRSIDVLFDQQPSQSC